MFWSKVLAAFQVVVDFVTHNLQGLVFSIFKESGA